MLADYEQLVKDFTRDDALKLLIADYDRAIAMAVQRYSKDRERPKVEDVTPTDANTLPLPAGWQADFSELRSLEYPIGQNPPSYLDQSRYAIYRAPASLVIKTIDAVNVAANTVRAAYTIAHQVEVATDTIPVADREPVAKWAAAICCEQLAALYSGNTDSTIQAATVENKSKAGEYSSRAKSLRKNYLDELGVDDKRNVAAGTVVTLPETDSRGQPRLTHSELYRNRPW
jgi:hypothetical protein